MKTAAIIAEYNPFHNGHAYHIAQTRNNGFSHIIAVMSGNYVQRGTPAILDRFYRAQAAVQEGADLVIELPLPWSSSAAPDFADGAVQIVKATGVVDSLSFGCEDDDLQLQMKAIEVLQSAALQDEIKKNIQKGDSYPVAVTKSLQTTGNASVTDFLSKPNNMLAFEYCKNIAGTAVSPLAIKRIGCEHDSDTFAKQFASASHIRKHIYNLYNSNREIYHLYNFIPDASVSVLKTAIADKAAPLDTEKFSLASISRLQTLSPADFALLTHVDNGLENRLFTAVQQSVTLEQAYTIAKNKQITHARIRRTLLHAVLGMHRFDPMKKVPYLRVLAANKKGFELLKIMKKSAALPIIMKHTNTDILDSYGLSVYNFNEQANDLYNLCLPSPKSCGFDKTKNIYIEK